MNSIVCVFNNCEFSEVVVYYIRRRVKSWVFQYLRDKSLNNVVIDSTVFLCVINHIGEHETDAITG